MALEPGTVAVSQRSVTEAVVFWVIWNVADQPDTAVYVAPSRRPSVTCLKYKLVVCG